MRKCEQTKNGIRCQEDAEEGSRTGYVLCASHADEFERARRLLREQINKFHLEVVALRWGEDRT